MYQPIKPLLNVFFPVCHSAARPSLDIRAWIVVWVVFTSASIARADFKKLENPPELITILEDLAVSSAQKTPQQTPIDNFKGEVYVANVEPGEDGDSKDSYLHTVVRRGVFSNDGTWSWSSKLIESRTVSDEWHTVPSVAVDKQGFVHVTYNMHNLPWQYKVSTEPFSIKSFEFRGEVLSDRKIDQFKSSRLVKFPQIGNAAISGTQITYPAFFKDNYRDLYITYRYAAKPALKFSDRTMSSAIAKYDTNDKSWASIGVAPELNNIDYKKLWTQWFSDPVIPKAFAMSLGWTSYHPRLTFGPRNELNVNWYWRKGIAGAELTRPCFVSSIDHIEFRNSQSELVELPVDVSNCSNIDGIAEGNNFYSVGNSTINANGEPHFILSPTTGSRKIVSFKDNSWHWEDSPFSATEIFFDANDNLWALATGLTILVRKKDEDTWVTVHLSNDLLECRPKASLDKNKTVAYIYTPNCKHDTISVKMISLELDG